MTCRTVENTACPLRAPGHRPARPAPFHHAGHTLLRRMLENLEVCGLPADGALLVFPCRPSGLAQMPPGVATRPSCCRRSLCPDPDGVYGSYLLSPEHRISVALAVEAAWSAPCGSDAQGANELEWIGLLGHQPVTGRSGRLLVTRRWMGRWRNEVSETMPVDDPASVEHARGRLS